MSLSIGIVGLPNVGKSTLFNALTANQALVANYPFATIEPNTGMVGLPDGRLDKLAELYHPERVVPAPVTFVDIAGLVRGAAEGQGLGNQFLANIREASAIVEVVRAFSDANVAHVAERIDPADDIQTINTELALADIQTLDRRLAKLESEAKASPKARPLLAEAQAIRRQLDAGSLNYQVPAELADLQLLTAKPIVYVFNLDEAGLSDDARQSELRQLVAPAEAMFVCAKLEAELVGLPSNESAELLKAVGQDEPGLNRLIKAGFKALGLQTFLTAGPKEVRAWVIPAGATAPQAAGVIHTDFEKGFIKAEVVSFEDLIKAGSLAAAKSAGKVRLEGRDYMMRDGDVVEFRFNV